MPTLAEVISGNTPFSEFMFEFSNYEKIYDQYTSVFSDDSVLVLNFESLVSDEALIQKSISDFLGISDFQYHPSENEKNKASQPKSVFLQKVMYSDTARKIARVLFASKKTELLRFRKKIVNANIEERGNPELESDLKAQLREKLGSQIEFYKTNI